MDKIVAEWNSLKREEREKATYGSLKTLETNPNGAEFTGSVPVNWAHLTSELVGAGVISEHSREDLSDE